MSLNPGMMSSNRDDWGTPPELFDRLDAEFQFGLDAAGLAHNARAPAYLGPDHPDPDARDALAVNWCDRLRDAREAATIRNRNGGFSFELPRSIWLNPPYGREIGAWMAKAREEGTALQELPPRTPWHPPAVVCLVPARTDTAWWHDHVMRASEIRLIRGRIRFVGAPSSAPFPSAVVVFGEETIPRLTTMEVRK